MYLCSDSCVCGLVEGAQATARERAPFWKIHEGMPGGSKQGANSPILPPNLAHFGRVCALSRACPFDRAGPLVPHQPAPGARNTPEINTIVPKTPHNRAFRGPFGAFPGVGWGAPWTRAAKRGVWRGRGVGSWEGKSLRNDIKKLWQTWEPFLLSPYESTLKFVRSLELRQMGVY